MRQESIGLADLVGPLAEGADKSDPILVGGFGERALLEAALARLDEAALAVMGSAATAEEQHQILGCLVSAHSLLHALSRLDPTAVDELIQRAIQLGARVSQSKTDAAGTK